MAGPVAEKPGPMWCGGVDTPCSTTGSCTAADFNVDLRLAVNVVLQRWYSALVLRLGFALVFR